MKVGAGGKKGAEFERWVAKRIVKAFRKKFPWVKQRDCWRSVLSGAHEMSSGDLRLTPSFQYLFPYSVECKFHKRIDWWKFLIPDEHPRGKEWKWIKQAIDGAKKSKGLLPLLVMKCNRGPVIACYPGTAIEGWRYETLNNFLKRAVASAK